MKKFLIAALIVLLMGFINIGVIAYDQTVPLPEEPVYIRRIRRNSGGMDFHLYERRSDLQGRSVFQSQHEQRV